MQLTITPFTYIFTFSYIVEFEMKDLINVMKALSEPNRVKILKMLQHRVMCVCEIKEVLQLSQPTVSRHLKVLKDAGLVGNRKEGLWVNYYLTVGDSSPYAANILGSLRHWLDDDREIETLVKKLPTIRREEVCKR